MRAWNRNSKPQAAPHCLEAESAYQFNSGSLWETDHLAHRPRSSAGPEVTGCCGWLQPPAQSTDTRVRIQHPPMGDPLGGLVPGTGSVLKMCCNCVCIAFLLLSTSSRGLYDRPEQPECPDPHIQCVDTNALLMWHHLGLANQPITSTKWVTQKKQISY